jgi:hypothetical protein
VYLWGCYTGQIDHAYQMLSGQNAAFPNTKFVVGFGAKGPLNTDPLSGRMLKDVLMREPQFRAASTPEMFQVLKTIPSYKQRDLIIHRGSTFVNQNGAMTQEDFLRSCQSDEGRKQVLKNSIQTIWDYYWNRRGPIPENTSKSELRSAYEVLQRNTFCITMGAVNLAKDFGAIPTENNVVALIFYRNVITNFNRNYMEYLQYAQKEMRVAGLNDVDFLTQMAVTERGALMQKLTALRAQAKARYGGTNDPEKTATWIYFREILNDLETVVYPSDANVSLGWIEPDSKDWGKFDTFARFQTAKAAIRKQLGLNP